MGGRGDQSAESTLWMAAEFLRIFSKDVANTIHVDKDAVTYAFHFFLVQRFVILIFKTNKAKKKTFGAK